MTYGARRITAWLRAALASILAVLALVLLGLGLVTFAASLWMAPELEYRSR